MSIDWPDVLGGALLSGIFALIAWRAAAVTAGGAAAGFICAVMIYAGAYLAGLAVLGAGLLLTTFSTLLGRARKEAAGIAEERGGRRAAGNILANCLVGAIGGALAAVSPSWSGELGSLVIVTGIAAGASDTVASEVGKVYGRRPRAFPSFRAVPPGTPGAVSLVGTMAGIVSAAAIAVPAVALWLFPADRLPLIVIACTIGAFTESALASRFEPRGVLDNNMLNVINTSVAALIAALSRGWLH